MCRLLETIRVESGKAFNLDYHQSRMDKAFVAIYGKTNYIKLYNTISNIELPNSGLYKLRIIYSDDYFNYQLEIYKRRIINQLRLVYDDAIEYNHKYENRDALNRLFDLRGNCDDVLIIKNGLVTDTSYANIALHDGSKWFTPATPLLQGTMRQSLIDSGEIEEIEIKSGDLSKFKTAALINSMNKLGESLFSLKFASSTI